MLFYRIVPALVERVTPENSPCSHQTALYYTIFFYCLGSVS